MGSWGLCLMIRNNKRALPTRATVYMEQRGMEIHVCSSSSPGIPIMLCQVSLRMAWFEVVILHSVLWYWTLDEELELETEQEWERDWERRIEVIFIRLNVNLGIAVKLIFFFNVFILLLFKYSRPPFPPHHCPPTPAIPTSLPWFHSPPWFCPCVLYSCSWKLTFLRKDW